MVKATKRGRVVKYNEELPLKKNRDPSIMWSCDNM